VSDVKPEAKPAAKSAVETKAPEVTHDEAPATPTPVAREELDRLVGGAHHNPHSILGAHPNPGAEGVTVRVLRPWARTVTVVTEDGSYPLQHEHRGIWAGVVPGNTVPDYRLDVAYGEDPAHRVDDGYRFLGVTG
jgi:1,4-alpha-glucan branching enzyme